MNKNSKEYYVISQVEAKIQNTSDPYLHQTYENGRLIYLDDNMKSLHVFIEILQKLTSSLFNTAPNHLKGDLREIEESDIKEILKNNNILLYGRSGMRLNSKELKKYHS